MTTRRSFPQPASASSKRPSSCSPSAGSPRRRSATSRPPPASRRAQAVCTSTSPARRRCCGRRSSASSPPPRLSRRSVEGSAPSSAICAPSSTVMAHMATQHICAHRRFIKLMLQERPRFPELIEEMYRRGVGARLPRDSAWLDRQVAAGVLPPCDTEALAVALLIPFVGYRMEQNLFGVPAGRGRRGAVRRRLGRPRHGLRDKRREPWRSVTELMSIALLVGRTPEPDHRALHPYRPAQLLRQLPRLRDGVGARPRPVRRACADRLRRGAGRALGRARRGGACCRSVRALPLMLSCWLLAATPHLLYHVVATGNLSTTDNALNIGILLPTAVIPAVLLWIDLRAHAMKMPRLTSEPGPNSRIPMAPEHGLLRRMSYIGSRRTLGKVATPVGVMGHSTPFLTGYGIFELASMRAKALDARPKDLARRGRGWSSAASTASTSARRSRAKGGITDDELRELVELARERRCSASRRQARARADRRDDPDAGGDRGRAVRSPARRVRRGAARRARRRHRARELPRALQLGVRHRARTASRRARTASRPCRRRPPRPPGRGYGSLS